MVGKHTHIYRGDTRARIAKTYGREYRILKNAIYEYLRRREGFEKGIDSQLIELAARLFANWLYIEEILSSPGGKTSIWKYADALAKIHGMLLAVLDELKISPAKRQRMVQGLAEDDRVIQSLKKVLEGK